MTTMNLADLVDAYGSPLYVYELDDVASAAHELRRALPRPSTLYYSLKANPHPLIARALRQAGCHAEVSSQGELAAALEAGFTGAEFLYTGPGKTRAEIADALDAGATRFSVESAGDYRRVAEVAEERGTTAQCLLRLNASESHGASGLRMTGTASQFGTDSAALIAAPELFAPRPGAHVIGMHFFALSNARDAESLLDSLVFSIAEAARVHRACGLPLTYVDLGGGFAAPYATQGERPDYSGLREPLEAVLDECLPGWRRGDTTVAFESGRHLVGGSGQLVCTVSDIKRSRDRTYVVLDTGINHLGGLAGLGRLLPMRASAVSTRPGKEQADTKRERVAMVGPLCTPADVLARETDLPQVGEEGLLAFPNVGAYGLTASLIGFLSRPVAAEVVLNAGRTVDASRIELRRTTLTPSTHRRDPEPAFYQQEFEK
ncbi:type III PLP-dependent enzyme [Streptomyces sp. NPDC013161]|uniref:type III PLP-dependent enzyme n=1 Tax=Streptomyces sp. NPDC013161 TaxID=3364862 RepID=UPI00369F9F21